MALRLICVVVLFAAASSLAACGRRPGTLDTPYDAAVAARKEAQENKEPLPPEPTPPVKDKPFILDPLI